MIQGDPVLLNGRAAKQCPVRVQNDFQPLVPTIKWKPTPEDQARLDAGLLFEAKVFERILACFPSATLINSRVDKAAAIDATLSAMDSGVPLILGGWLPDDPEGGRSGRPDILVRVEGGYLPADVKNHQTIKHAKTTCISVSSLLTPDLQVEVVGWTVTAHRYDDGLQLAHYTRMLEACGYHPGGERSWGAILGTNELQLSPDAGVDWVLVWHDLTKPIGYTFSRSRGKVSRSLLERYDHEHGFRVKVASIAKQIIGTPTDPVPLVEPVGQKECTSCPYDSWCAEQMGPDDPSTAINIGKLSTREWLALRRMGISTTSALAAVDIDDPSFFNEYLAEVIHLGAVNVRKRLVGAIERAQMICDGIAVVRIGEGPVEVPFADVEIDVDVESDVDGRVYMWGARVRRGGDESTATYVGDFVVWEEMDSRSERDLATRFAAWLRTQREAAEVAGETVKVFHWSHPESSRLRSILGAADVDDLIGADVGLFVDLEKVFKANFFSLHGSSIKKVAPHFGFAWRADDPGGDTSQLYLAKVRANPGTEVAADARRWLLTYNEDDNAAMARIRNGMREWAES